MTAPHEQIARIESQVNEWTQAQLKDFDNESLAWLSLVPVWSERLAELAGFPCGSFSLEEFLNRAQDEYICERDKRDRQAENAQRSARVLAVLWQRMDEDQKRKLAPQLDTQVRAMNAGPDQKRMLRYLEPYVAESGVRALFLRFRTTVQESAESNRKLEFVLRYVSSVKDRAPSALDPSLTPSSATNVQEGDLIDPALKALSEINDPEVAMRAVASLGAILPDAAKLIDFVVGLAAKLTSPEIRTQLLQYVASSSRGELRKALQAQSIESADNIQDPADRALALLNTRPDVPRALRDRVSQKLLEAAREISEPGLRARILTGVLPFLTRPDRTSVGSEALAIADHMDPVQRFGILLATAPALAQVGEVERAYELAEKAGSPKARAQILLEIEPHILLAEKSTAAAAVSALDPVSLEEVLNALSPEAGSTLAKTDATRIAETARQAGAAGRFSIAAKLASFLPERSRTKLAGDLLGNIRAVPSLPERLEAISQIAACLSPSLLETAVGIATNIESSRRFWVADSARAEIIKYLRERNGPAFLPKAVIAAGKGIVAASQKAVLNVAPATSRWASIAEQCVTVSDAAAFVTSRIRTAVSSGNTGEALDILNIAAPLAEIIGAELEPAVVLGRHRIQIAFRQAADERHLLRYLPRQEQIDAFKELIDEPDGPDSHWALHYLGMSGVGKTMMLRHIMARLAVKDGNKLPVTRVDFDHISPDFPARKPGELLASLAEELRFYGVSQESRFNDFINHLNTVHEMLSNEPPPNEPLHNIEIDQFRTLLDKFSALLNELPKPVILILDTCEELAKLEPAGAMLPSVEATFTILEQLHSRAPHIRIVFAGRRLLAQAGHKQSDGQYRWAVKPGSLSERNKLLPTEKDYLRLNLVRGFTEPEASNFFSQIVQLEIDNERRKAILGASPDAGVPADIKWNGEPQPIEDVEDRYNPFDLSLYADWIREDPNVRAEVISSGETDPYVEVRIVRRITDDALRKALPAAVLLRRFDIDMLRHVVTGGDNDLRRVYRDLGGQEWIDYQQGVLQVDTNLLPRLERYYECKDRRYLRDRAQEALLPALTDRFETALKAADPFSLLTVATVDAALRLLPASEAAKLWDQLDRKVTDLANWSWADNVCSYLVIENNAAGSEKSPLRAAVRATMAAAALHNPPYQPVLRWWQDVANKVEQHPDPKIRSWLKARAAIVLGTRSEEQILLIEEIREDQWRYEQLMAGFAASLERSTNNAAELRESGFRYDSLPLELRAFITTIYARGTTDQSLVDACKRLAGLLSSTPGTWQRWADWRIPACLPDRMRLELLRLEPKNLAWDFKELTAWSHEAASRLDNIDSERLLSRVIQLALEQRVFHPPEVPLGIIYDPNRRPESPVHKEVAPLFATMAEALLVAGRGADAFELATAAQETARAKQDTEAIDAAKLALLRIARRMRGPAALTSTTELIGSSQPSATKFHGWWAIQVARSDEDTANLIAAVERQGASAFCRSDGGIDAFSALDALELDLLATRIGRPADYAQRYSAKNDPLLPTLPPRESFRLALRERALGALKERDSFLPLRKREGAEIALEEAELLALRLPSRAEFLFQKSIELFEASSDSFGAFRATVSGALANPSLDQKSALDTLDRARFYYKDCRATVVDLPDWEHINPTELSGYKDHYWFDWLIRVTRLKARAGEWEIETGTTALDKIIADRYGTQNQFDLTTTSIAVPADKPKWPTYVGIFSGALVMVTAIAAVHREWQQDPEVIIIGAGVIGGLILIALLAAIVLPVVARLFFRIRRPQLLVQAGNSADKVTITFQLNSANRDVQVDSGSESNSLARPAYQNYLDVAPRFHKALIPLKRLQEWLLSAGVPVTLTVDRTLEHYAWEAPLNLSVPSFLTRDSFHFIRLSDARSAPLDLEEWRQAGVHVTCRSGLGDVVDRAWQPIKTNVTVNTSGVFSSPAEGPFRVLHLVGWSTRTTSGPTFSIERPIGSRAPVPVNVSAFSVDPAIVIVQEDPVERIRRLDVDREQTAQTRAFAAELFRDRTQQTVILIPALPLSLARRVVETFAKGFRGSKPPDTFELLKVVTAARRTIVRFRPPKVGPDMPDLAANLTANEWRNAVRELSLEITVFSRPESKRDRSPAQYMGFTPT